MNVNTLTYNDSATTAKRRKLILSTAFDFFIKKSIDDTSIMEIADAAGMARRTFYNYYKTKETIAEDLQIICLEKMEWYTHMHTIVVDSSRERLFLTGKFLLENYLPELQYISLFDFYFSESYASKEYLEYIKKKQAVLIKETVKSLKIQTFSLLSKNRKQLTLLQVFSGYLQRISLRIPPGEKCPEDYLDELKLFLSSML